MFYLERISNRIAAGIASSLGYNKDQEEIIAYGAFGFLQTILSFILVLIIGFIFNVLIEAFVISLVAALLRKYSGGVHASTPGRCTIIGLIVSIGFALIISKVGININFILTVIIFSLLFLLSLVIMYMYSPVDTPNKPITNDELRRKLKKGSIIFLFIMLLAAILTLVVGYLTRTKLYNVTLSIGIGIMWQSFMLTALGHALITSVDNIIDSIKKRRYTYDKEIH